MDSDLLKQQQAFKKTLQSQPILKRHVPTNDNASTATLPIEQSNSSVESLAEELRFEVTDIRHVNSYVHAIISTLKTIDRKISFEEIRRLLNIDLEGNAEVLEKVCLNERIIYDAGTKQLAYRHLYDVRNETDLLRSLHSHANIGGILVQDLRPSFPKIDAAVEEGVRAGQVIAFRGKSDDAAKVLFLNQMRLEKTVDPRFKELWASLTLPDTLEMGREMERAGLKAAGLADAEALQAGKPGALPPPKKKAGAGAKRSTRRIKITNTHIEGLDFSIDPPA
jgi:transcription initiation factor TFIIE subunit beta